MASKQDAGWTLSAGGVGSTVDITLLPGNQVQISDTFVAKGGNRVTWTVTNSSNADVAVRVEEFLLKNAVDPRSPITDTPLENDQRVVDFGTIPDGETAVRATKVKPLKNGYRGAWAYKYTLVVGTTRIDPELVVEWP